MRYLLSLLCLCFFASCSKDDKKSEPTKTDLLTASAWVFESGGLDTNKDGTAEFPISSVPGIMPCMLDNKGTFKTDHTGINDEGTLKCDPAAPQTSTFNWSFGNNETTLNVQGSGLFGLGGQFRIITLNSTNLSLAKDTTISVLGSIAIIATLKHQ